MAEKLIEIGKIVRNTTKSNLNNGDMEEIVNLRREEGKWKPLTENVRIWNGIEPELEFYSQLFVHTGKNYKHILGVLKDGFGVDYVANIIDNDNVEIIPDGNRATGVFAKQDFVQVHQVGNLLCINDKNKVQFIQWKNNNKYVHIDIDYNGDVWSDKLSPIGNMKLRVKPITNDKGVPQLLLTPGNLDEDNKSGTWEGLGFNELTASNNGLGCIAQARKTAKELGWVNGFTIAVVALELYDGSYAYTGMPVMLPQANDSGTRYKTDRGYEREVFGNNIDTVKDECKQGGQILSKPYTYNENPKGMDLIRPEVTWGGLTKVYLGEKIEKETNEAINFSYGYKTNAAMTYGMLSMGGQGEGSNSATYARLDLFGLEKGDSIKNDVVVPYAFQQYTFDDSKDLDSFEYADQYATMRSCSCCEQMTTKSTFNSYKNKRLFNKNWLIMHPDCFNPPNAFAITGTIAQVGTSRSHISSGEQADNFHTCWGVLAGQKLQIRIDDMLDDVVDDIVKNVCVFMSSEIYYANESGMSSDLIETYEVKSTGSSHAARELQHSGYTIYAKPKKDEEIKKEIEDTAVLYKIYSAPCKTIRKGEWIDIKMDEILNILEESETLPVDATMQRNGFMAECAYMYNGRLHIGNITETKFSGYPLNEMEIPEQWSLTAMSKHSRAPYSAKSKDNNKYWMRFISSTGYYIKVDNKLYRIDEASGEVNVNGQTYSADRDAYKFTYNNCVYYAYLYESEWITDTANRNAKDIKVSKQGQSNMFTVISYDGVISTEPISVSSTHYNYIVSITTESNNQDITTIYESEKITLSDDEFKKKENIDIASGKFKANYANYYIQSREACAYPVCEQWAMTSMTGVSGSVTSYVIVDIKTEDGNITVGRLCKKNATEYKPLNPMISYPSSQATKMRIGYVTAVENGKVKVKESVFELKPFKAVECASFVSGDLKPICWWQDAEASNKTDIFGNNVNKQDYYFHETSYDANDLFMVEGNEIVGISEVNNKTYRRNVLKVSATESPLFFPAENTYQVGNGEIVGMCSNTVALSTGQWGDAPLYVFCSDGIYGLFVDSSGQLVYPYARPISREVCNNSLGITPIDDAVVYPSERGLFMISGSQNHEISKPVEGRPLQFAEEYGYERLDSMPVILNKRGNNGEVRNDSWLNECMRTAPTDEDFKEYIKNAKCGWGYTHSEVWVSNPDKDYTYIFSDGGWSKVMRKIEYFINDYPRTYFVSKSESDGDVSYEVYDMGKNNDAVITDCFFLTRPIVIDGELAKTFTEAWLYGNFSVALNRPLTDEDRKFVHKASIIVYGSQDGTKFSMIGIGGVRGETRNIIAKLHRMSMRYIRIAFAGRLRAHSELECLGVEAKMSWGEKSSKKVR